MRSAFSGSRLRRHRTGRRTASRQPLLCTSEIGSPIVHSCHRACRSSCPRPPDRAASRLPPGNPSRRVGRGGGSALAIPGTGSSDTTRIGAVFPGGIGGGDVEVWQGLTATSVTCHGSDPDRRFRHAVQPVNSTRRDPRLAGPIEATAPDVDPDKGVPVATFKGESVTPPVTPLRTAARPGLQGRALGVTQYVRGGRRTLTDVSLTVAAGELLAVVGASGAGKTMLLETLAGVRAPAVGTVLYDGVDYFANRAAFRSSLGYVP